VSLVQKTDVTIKSSLCLHDTAAVTKCRPPLVAISASDAQWISTHLERFAVSRFWYPSMLLLVPDTESPLTDFDVQIFLRLHNDLWFRAGLN
jgi:hypothetical protein